MDANFEAGSDRACFFGCFLMSSAYCLCGFRLHLQTDVQSDGWARQCMKGLTEYLPSSLRYSLAAVRPALFNPSSLNTGSLNQDPAVFSARLMYSRKSVWSAKPPGTGSHVASGSHSVLECAVLGSDVIGTGIKWLTSVEGINTGLKSQNTVTE